MFGQQAGPEDSGTRETSARDLEGVLDVVLDVVVDGVVVGAGFGGLYALQIPWARLVATGLRGRPRHRATRGLDRGLRQFHGRSRAAMHGSDFQEAS